MTPAIREGHALVVEVEHLVKRYPGVTAVDDLSFSVRRGEIFGLLGPNGAGKSTTLGVLQGLRRADAGRARVLGFNVATHTPQMQRRIGVQLQSTSLLPDLRAVEQVLLFAHLYGRRLTRDGALALLDEVELRAQAGMLPDRMSGGQQKRLALALALVNDPELLFLDEPTAGLDPQSRRRLWAVVRALSASGRTVVLTTHHMEEAEELCHRVGIIDRGRLLALDSPGALINTLDASATVTTALAIEPGRISTLPGVRSCIRDGSLVRLESDDVPATIGALLEAAAARGLRLHDLHVRQPSLEDVFLNLTGRTIRE